MENKQPQPCCEKFKTSIGGQALIEGIMMRGPEKDATAVRTADGIQLELKDRKIRKKGSFATWPLIRGAVNFFDSQVVGVKALMHSADLSPEEGGEEATLNSISGWKRSLAAKASKRSSSVQPFLWVWVFPSFCFSCFQWLSAASLTDGSTVRWR